MNASPPGRVLSQDTFINACLHNDTALLGSYLAVGHPDRLEKVNGRVTSWLQLALENRQKKIVKHLYERSVSPVLEGFSLFLAAREGDYEAIKIIDEVSDGCINTLYQNAPPPVVVAAMQGHRETVDTLCKCPKISRQSVYLALAMAIWGEVKGVEDILFHRLVLDKLEILTRESPGDAGEWDKTQAMKAKAIYQTLHNLNSQSRLSFFKQLPKPQSDSDLELYGYLEGVCIVVKNTAIIKDCSLNQIQNIRQYVKFVKGPLSSDCEKKACTWLISFQRRWKNAMPSVPL